ncbi:MAG TPA: ABC transporter ATP-binding protein [Gaiellaceae bacterium]|jgi:ABC-type sulfate/molybdate transport systems ATPase subunit
MATLAATLDVPLRDFRLGLSLRTAGTLALVGPSGAGKTTVLRAVAGLTRPASGRIALDDEVWFDSEARTWRAPEDRRVGLVFQEYALFPHLTVRQNVAFGGRDRVDELLERFGIAALAQARPGGLSGGERQRVALARALARGPGVLLLDEPLSALDAHTRATVRGELRALLRDFAGPALLVTHDFDDAAALADEVGVVAGGTLRQVAPPAELVAAPADAFVASLTGANLLRGRVVPHEGSLTALRLEHGPLVLSTDAATGAAAAVVYPWEVTVAHTSAPDSAQNHVQGFVRTIVRLGNRARVTVGDVTAEVTTESLDRLGLREGEAAVASWKATATRLVPL